MKVQVLPGGLTCRRLPDRPRPSGVDFSFITDGHELYQMAVDKWQSEAASMPVYPLKWKCKEGEVVEVELKEEVVHGKIVRDDYGFSIGGEQVVETIAVPIDREQAITEIMQEDEKNGLNDHLTSTEANKKRLEESAEQLGESYSREEVIKIMEWVDECVIRHEDSLWELWANMGETDPEEKYTTSQLLDIYNTTKA